MRLFEKKSGDGFTLIELMIAVALMAILASVMSVSIGGLIQKARDAKRKGDIDAIRAALEFYYQDYQRYPTSGNCGALAPNNQWCVSNDPSWDVLATALRPYMERLPKDPLRNTSGRWAASPDYGYGYFSVDYGCDGQQYILTYALENMTGVSSPGLTLCNGMFINYGGAITFGERK
jgi:prepilin-type N-terminal cleavage/methylation domain-containing protein